MGIYIKSMKMPKNDCTAYREVIISNNYIGNGKMKILVCDAQTNTFIGEAIEIPEPHGRLIDVDACIDYIRSNNQHAWETLAYAPTVIEGSEPLER